MGDEDGADCVDCRNGAVADTAITVGQQQCWFLTAGSDCVLEPLQRTTAPWERSHTNTNTSSNVESMSQPVSMETAFCCFDRRVTITKGEWFQNIIDLIWTGLNRTIGSVWTECCYEEQDVSPTLAMSSILFYARTSLGKSGGRVPEIDARGGFRARSRLVGWRCCCFSRDVQLVAPARRTSWFSKNR